MALRRQRVQLHEIESIQDGNIVAGPYRFHTSLPAKIGDLTDGKIIRIPNILIHPDMSKTVLRRCKELTHNPIAYLNKNANTIFMIKGNSMLSYWREEILIRNLMLMGLTKDEIQSLHDFGLAPLEIKERLMNPISLLPLSIGTCQRVVANNGGKIKDLELGKELREIYRYHGHLGAIPDYEDVKGMNTLKIGKFLLLEHQRRFRDVILKYKHKIECIYGPAGTGKTTKFKTIDADCYLAFTGKAVDRIKDVIPDRSKDVMTIHSFLGYRKNVRTIVLDEASMVNSQLLSCLLKHCMKLICIGDPNQLQPIGTGAPFKALIKTNVKKTRLLRIYRNEGSILSGLTDILNGRLPRVLDDTISIVNLGIEFAVRQNSLIITPFRDDVRIINERVYPGEIGIGMKVMVTENTSEAFNGMIGTVLSTSCNAAEVEFGDKTLSVDLNFLTKAAAITVHKSQGSEFDNVVFYLPTYKDFITRELVYTAMSRAKKKLTIVTDPKILAKCICNISEDKNDLL